MGRLSIAGACAIVAMAIIGIAAGTAGAATPAWYECVKAKPKNTGNETNKTCTAASEPGKGAYELKEGVGKAKEFKGKSAKKVPQTLHINTVFGNKSMECAAASDKGKPAVPNLEEKVSVTFTGCAAEGNACNTAGAKAGEIVVSGLKGELGYLSESPDKVGVRLESEAHPGYTGELAHVVCGPELELQLVGGVIGEQTGDVGALNKDSTVTYTAEARIGVHEFDKLKYTPIVNQLGWADESGAIEKEVEEDLEGKLKKIERPIIKSIICGELIEDLLHEHCSPEAYSGLEGAVANKGESLEILEEPPVEA